MPERPDLRLIAGNIREALAGFDRDQLLDILTYVFKEYVVEGPPPLLVHQAERLADLEGLTFPQLVAALQTRLDLVELSMFTVEGEQVFVRVGGVKTPLTGVDAAAAARQNEPPAEGARPPAPAQQPTATAPQQPQRPQAGVYVVETGLLQRPPASERPTVDEAVERGRADIAGVEQRRGVTPRPTGISLRGRPGGGGGAMAPEEGNRAAEPPPAPAAQPAPAAKPATASDGDDTSIRFSLLELD